MPHKEAIGSRKGGVGKTTVVLGRADALAQAGRKVLVIDLDPQSDATTVLGRHSEYTAFDVLYAGDAGTLGAAAAPTDWKNVDLIAGSPDLARIESESLLTPELRLKTSAWGSAQLDGYDDILIDTPPALGRLTLNALLWSDSTIVVTDPTAFGLTGVGQYLETVAKVRALPHLNPSLRFAGIVVNRVTPRLTSEHRYRVEELEATYGEVLLRPFLPERTAMQDAESRRRPLSSLTSPGALVLTERFAALTEALHGVAA
ncbi:ParA family protein [Plantibacter sp. VKM Ac-2885]|uniref:ParA family protein n=1 Tax=Plantibacter sp. VKM Ac-2885 TaxID=2783828 RepID=UPI00188BEB92|nr:ParA family protein [Plantibacter sp. VKM Ac-2885]MBF4514053.1 ParA family protein [Plantibacter sp. VKM Ac-2885]